MVTLRRSVLVGAAAVGALLGGFWLGRAAPAGAVTPVVRQGTVTLVDIDGTAFAVRINDIGSPHSYAVPVLWIDAQGSHHDDGHPACLAPLSQGQHIVYGLVQVEPAHGADGTDLVAWVRCANP